MAEVTTEDPVGTAAATTEEEDMVAESTAIEVMEAGVQRRGPGPPQNPGGQSKLQRTPRQWVRRENVRRPAEWKGVQQRLWPGPQLR